MVKSVLGFAIAAMPLAPLSASATVLAQFADNTFDLANYSFSQQYATGGTMVYDQCQTCGNPGQALQIEEAITDPVNGGVFAQGFQNVLWSYDPSTQGALGSINASVDKDASTTIDANFSSGFHPFIFQNGNYYVASLAGPNYQGPGSSGWVTIGGTHLTAADFIQYDFATNTYGTANPDFDGSAMAFGLVQFTTAQGIGLGSLEQDYDNLDLSLLSVPEPGALSLLGAALLGLAGIGLRRKPA